MIDFFEELDHTADIGFRVHAGTLADLFAVSARALFHFILAEGDRGDEELPREISVIAIDIHAAGPDLLLREWLGELLYLHTTRRLFFDRFDIDTCDSVTIHARVSGHVLSAELAARATEIKAVTYHGLTLQATSHGFDAAVVLDT